MGCRYRLSGYPVDRFKPSGDGLSVALQVFVEPTLERVESVKHVIERIGVLSHVGFQHPPRDRFGAAVYSQNRAYVGMHHEARKRPQHQVPVVGVYAGASLGMGDSDHAVNVRISLGAVPQPGFQLPYETGRLRGNTEKNDVVSGSNTPVAATVVSVKRWWVVRDLDRLSWNEGGLVQFVGHQAIFEVRLIRKGEIDPAHPKRIEHVCVADVVTGRDISDCPTEGQAPGQDRLAGADVLDGESMPFEQRMAQRKGYSVVIDHPCSGFQSSGNYGHVVARFG